ncbi:MAG: ribonuclease III domain-containing protein [Nostocaceae cyanobacterium]|nr:ribonuclease III domain-containing protein [Nostocaceae cyanobacterium]
MTSKEEQRFNCPETSTCQDLAFTGLADPKAAAVQLTKQVSGTQLQQISPTALAYLGDAVYELYVRNFYLVPPQRSDTYHRLVVAQVRAETQAIHLQCLIPYLNDTELEVIRRGRNAATGRPKRLEPAIYQQATSFETLIGYLYLSDSQRLTELLEKLNLEK